MEMGRWGGGKAAGKKRSLQERQRRGNCVARAGGVASPC